MCMCVNDPRLHKKLCCLRIFCWTHIEYIWGSMAVSRLTLMRMCHRFIYDMDSTPNLCSFDQYVESLYAVFNVSNRSTPLEKCLDHDRHCSGNTDRDSCTGTKLCKRKRSFSDLFTNFSWILTIFWHTDRRKPVSTNRSTFLEQIIF